MTDQEFHESDFVYVDPETRTVVGPVVWNENGNAKPLQRPAREPKPEAVQKEGVVPRPARPDRKPRVRNYPWGSYRSMSDAYRLKGKAGKEAEAERYIPLEDAISKLMENPYWN